MMDTKKFSQIVKNDETERANKIDDIVKITNEWIPQMRIDWNEYFMCLAVLTASRSPCNRLHVGCVLVKDKRVVSVGYNGFPSGEDHVSFIRKDVDGMEHEMATIHAEQNALCYGAKFGVSLDSGVAYITHYPCLNCAKLLLSCGITIIYYHEDYHNDCLVKQICSKLHITQI